jgi:hypothetical protein
MAHLLAVPGLWQMNGLERGRKFAYTFASAVETSNRIRYVLQVTREMGMATNSSLRWRWIVVALLALCVLGYIWTLQ